MSREDISPHFQHLVKFFTSGASLQITKVSEVERKSEGNIKGCVPSKSEVRGCCRTREGER